MHCRLERSEQGRKPLSDWIAIPATARTAAEDAKAKSQRNRKLSATDSSYGRSDSPIVPGAPVARSDTLTCNHPSASTPETACQSDGPIRVARIPAPVREMDWSWQQHQPTVVRHGGLWAAWMDYFQQPCALCDPTTSRTARRYPESAIAPSRRQASARRPNSSSTNASITASPGLSRYGRSSTNSTMRARSL